ncbi:magnesium-translocating P-type ATPase [Gemmobacter straminiformis]|uniref:Magnesium-transporting ATPase, P-type 1 n=1 Tax=Paragemmobacter straminiformis TaxID=2045119 RepID=A0A842IBE3_9RHOB|nr:magnesium-translocating P-type ATPase [Gemmobacter straminiformis]MBC2836896.1 magnesium-translocating P-type ATPase [Gemmobacter straminiformis]
MPEAWWSADLDRMFAATGSSARGLSEAEAIRRLALAAKRRGRRRGHGVAALLWRQYESPLVLILVLAAVVSVIVGEWTEAAIILAIVAGSTLLGFAQEYKAARAVAQLQERLALTVAVLRDGAVATVPAEAVVAGDVVVLSAGNLVPADGVLCEARDFLVSQAALTGESFPVEKRVGVSAPDAPLAGRDNAVFLGTSVRSGTARMLVAVTGAGTAYGKIEERIGESDPETDFERGIRRFGSLLMRVMMVIVTVVLSANLVLGRPVIDSLLFSVALAVGLTPELLPAIVSVTMAEGARRMARGGVLVRRSSAIENLGTVDILCTDKTGTLTSGQMALQAATDPSGAESAEVFGHALVNAHFETGIENPLDMAIVAAAAARGVPLPERGKIDEIPYDFQRKRLTVVVDLPESDDHLVVTKGAFDTVLSCCDRIGAGAGTLPLGGDERARLADFVARKGAEGIRVLAVATRVLPPRARYDVADETAMTFAGFLLFADPLKEGIGETLDALRKLGIGVKIITGDNRHVAEHVARAVGLEPRMIAGADLQRAGDEALWHLAKECNVFAEADPQQKERIVRALQKRGHSVAYMGDGINDAPALQHADVGISVQEAVDVARESADIVLLQRDLDVLRQGIVDGRQTFANTLKYISITTSANFGNMISMAVGTLFLPFLPLTAAQILLNNFLSDIPSLSLAGDRVDPEAVEHAPRWDIAAIRNYMVIFGMVSTLFDLLTFAVLLRVFHADAGMFQTAWFTISLLTELVVVFVLRTRRALWNSRPARVLVLASLAMFAVALVLPSLGPVARAVGLSPLPLPVLASGIGIVLCYALATEAVKRRLLR